MNRVSRKWVALAMCSAALGAGAVFVFAANDKPAPIAEEKTAKEDWLPKPRPEKGGRAWGPIAAPPSAFPDLALPEKAEKRDEEFDKRCPRLSGKLELKIEATDDTLRKLLKARLHMGVWEMVMTRKVIRDGNWNAQFSGQVSDCLLDIQDAVSELYAKEPKELVAWLEELVIQAKEMERFYRTRVIGGTDPPQRHTAAARDRLKIEEALVKAKKK